MKTALGGLLLVMATLVLLPAPAIAGGPTCHGVRATIVGTRHADVIRGTRHRDVIVAGRGNDVVKGRGGNDLICGGPGADRLEGGAGRDHLLGQGDFINHGEAEACDRGDILDGGRSDDVLAPGRDPHAGYSSGCLQRDAVQFLQGGDHGVRVDLVKHRATGQGRDRIVGTYAINVVGSDHDDVLLGTDFSEKFTPRKGNDVVRARGGDDNALEGSKKSNGNDVFDMGDGDDFVYTSHGHDAVQGGDGDDQLILENQVAMPTVDGGDGDDYISRYAVLSGETVTGGAGTDALSIILRDSPGPQAELDIPGGTITVDGVSAEVTDFYSWNFVSNHPLLVHGSDLGESVRAGGWDGATNTPLTAYMAGGDDTVEGLNSDDYVDGGDGTDTANLGGGTNTCVNVELGDC